MSNRLQNVLTSIFLPRDSVYADLDDPEEGVNHNALDLESSIASATSPTAHHRQSLHSHGQIPSSSTSIGTRILGVEEERLVEEEEEEADSNDPFATSPLKTIDTSRISPSVNYQTSTSPKLHSNFSNQPGTGLNDSKSPFHDIPTTTNQSIFLNSTPSSSRSPPRSHNGSITSGILNHPNQNNRGGRKLGSGSSSSGSHLANSDTGSAIGNRSLMGLLGGTRYGVRGFEGIELLNSGNEVVEEEEEEELMTGRGRGRNTRDLSIMNDQELAASLPPPPSALSPSSYDSRSTHSEEEEQYEDDLPPDFTVPHSTRRKRNSTTIPLLSDPSSATNSHSTGWAGLHLGGGPIGGILDGSGVNRKLGGMGAKERALWRWINVEDLDAFLQEVYVYYVGKGIWAIGLSRLLNLLTVGWVIFFSTFLLGCIDYNVLWTSHHLSEVVVDSCITRFSGLTFTLFISFTSFYIWRIVRFGLGVKKLWAMHEFYGELLEVPEDDIQTIPWHVIVSQLSILRASHPSALSLARTTTGSPSNHLDAHDVANRIMREENYLIALFNKDVLDITIPIPELVAKVIPSAHGWGNGMLTRTLEWNLSFCLTGFLFGKDGQVRRAFVSERNRKELTEALRRRFVLMGLINAVFAPFIVLYLLMYSFFRYFEEYHKNPSSIGSRQFTQLARWKFREFNELPHLFQQRINRAHPLSEQYINQFPKEKTALVSRFIAFLAGSFAAVLLLFSLIDPDAFLHFEITPGRTVLFYITIFGVILAVARGMVPDENRVVDPEELMKKIVEHTHYLPIEWRGKLHSAEVHVSFGQLFQMKIAQLVQELLSVVVTPFVLWYTLPSCAGAIVDFFREFTVHVDGLGYVCSFAVFDFKRHGDTRFGAPVQAENDRLKSKEGKMEKSFLAFTSEYPNYVPRDQSQSLFLSKMTEVSVAPTTSTHHHQNNSTHNNLQSRFSRSISTPRSNNSRYSNNFTTNSTFETESRSKPVHLTSSSIGTAGGGNKLNLTKRSSLATRVEQVIDEESGLDGDSYIATTESQPFGHEVDLEEVDDTNESRKNNNGLAGLLGEVYESKKW